MRLPARFPHSGLRGHRRARHNLAAGTAQHGAQPPTRAVAPGLCPRDFLVQEYWSGLPASSRGSSPPRTSSCLPPAQAGGFLTIRATTVARSVLLSFCSNRGEIHMTRNEPFQSEEFSDIYYIHDNVLCSLPLSSSTCFSLYG